MLKKYEALSEQVNPTKTLMAQAVINRYIKKTSLTHYSELSRLIGCEAFVKHENHNPTGSFKIRGALNFFHHMSTEELEGGILVATKGNHGLAMAWAGQWFQVPCTVVVPQDNNPEINRIIESYGAEVIVHGEDFYDAQSYCEELVDSAGYYYVKQGNEPEILNGLATMGLEIMEDLPAVDTIICPIGGGAGCASLIKTVRAFNPAIEIIGVEPHNAASFYHAWKKGEIVILDESQTIADGLAARSVFQLPYVILKDAITDVVLLTEDEILEGIRMALSATHNLAEAAGAVSLIAAYKIKERLCGKKVVMIMSGGNLTMDNLKKALSC
ncbi:MAG TPA: threonine/serine dehydratase [Smithellaceae bacterium]|jgi:threonine dehydratase|nr:threonine/serine dehydratase [Syntrophaceae bacterium]MDX9815626.1 threonine/serine dehydratase [Smithellaceae bacterium]NMD06095.1 threonine/serine dehydratase [Deltaproteobacteria bacterium]MBP8608814.1 threonine/serine dehydratase [Syntrophaceae bacterium]HNQ17537.1 threonine/serine dehydratase [Smithellaceae bacterium]